MQIAPPKYPARRIAPRTDVAGIRFVWLGLYLREGRLKALIPIRRNVAEAPPGS